MSRILEAPRSHYRWLILTSVIASRLVYAISWFDVSPALTAIQGEFHTDLPSLGILTAIFLLGVGIFQIPAGGLAARWGAKPTALLGLFGMASAGIVSGLAPNFEILLASRFVVGLGAACFFAPAIGIITPLFEPREEGFVVGLYNGAFGVGAGVGLFGWSLLEEGLGWRLSLIICGVITALIALENYIVIRGNPVPQTEANASIRSVIQNRSVWFWAVGLLGFWGALYAVNSFLQPFAETQLTVQPPEAGLLASLVSFASVLGGPIGGRLSDHFRSRRGFMVGPAVIFGIGAILIGQVTAPVLWLMAASLGFIEGFVFAALYSSPSQLPDIGTTYAPLAIGLINSVQILGSVWMPVVFTVLADTFGYSYGWAFLGLASVGFLPLVIATKEPFKYAHES